MCEPTDSMLPSNLRKFILIKEIVRGPFGTLFRCWRKDKRGFAALAFIDAEADADAVAILFSQIQKSAREAGAKVSGIAEVGEFRGRRYVCLTIS